MDVPNAKTTFFRDREVRTLLKPSRGAKTGHPASLAARSWLGKQPMLDSLIGLCRTH